MILLDIFGLIMLIMGLGALVAGGIVAVFGEASNFTESLKTMGLGFLALILGGYCIYASATFTEPTNDTNRYVECVEKVSEYGTLEEAIEFCQNK